MGIGVGIARTTRESRRYVPEHDVYEARADADVARISVGLDRRAPPLASVADRRLVESFQTQRAVQRVRGIVERHLDGGVAHPIHHAGTEWIAGRVTLDGRIATTSWG